MKRFLILLFIIGFGFFCFQQTESKGERADSAKPDSGGVVVPPADSLKPLPDIKVTSSAFVHEGMIPVRYTCDGDDRPPEIFWRNIPKGTASLALICDDPDAPAGTWVHWVVYNIAPEDTCLSIRNKDKKPTHLFGKNSWGRSDYGGPCPPSGEHRYYFRIYALKSMLDLKAGATKEQLLKAMEGRVLTTGELMGRYSRQK